jgi:hypothetical protein
MKRFFVVAAVVGLLAAGAAQAEQNCLWNESGECWPVGSQVANCETNAWLFEGGTTGADTFCKGGTFLRGKTNTPPSTAVPAKGCCRWSTEAPKCFNVYTDADVRNCSGGANTYWSGGCVDKAADGESYVCPSGAPTYDGSDKTPENWESCTGDYSGYCKWETGCSRISTCTGGDPGSDCANADATCSAAYDNCLSNSSSQTVYGDDACNTPKQSGGVDVGGAGHCKVNGLLAFCGYEPYESGAGGCYKVQNQYAPNIGKTCDELISACTNDYGKIYTGTTSPSVLDSEPYGDGESCSALGLSTTSVKLLGSNAAKIQGLKVSYAKNRVTVNWTPSAKVAGGTVQLINAKGVALSTAFIKANSSKVSVKLGTVGVPAGMYFVHINAVGQNGKKIVTNSAVSIVK